MATAIVAGAANVTSALFASGLGPEIQYVDALFPPFLSVDVLLSLFFIALITAGNLRGIRESGTIFALPVFFTGGKQE